MSKRYLNLVESYMRRYERGGYLVGDVVKFADDFKSTDSYKKIGKNVQDLIDQMIETGLNVRVVGIKDTTAPIFPGNPQTSTLDVVLTLAVDNGGGRYSHYISVPTDLVGEPMELGVNLPPIPDAVKYDGKIQLKPKEVDEIDHITNKTDKGNAKLSKTNRALPKKNVSLSGKGVDQSLGQANYTLKYLDGLKK